MISDRHSVNSQLRDRLGAISHQAGKLKDLGKPELVNSFLESSFTPAVETFAPGSELSAYAAMVQETASAISSISDRPDLAQKLWETALDVASAGIPGAAGVALAKTVAHVSKGLPATDQSTLNHEGLLNMQPGPRLLLKGERLQASIALRTAEKQPNLQGFDEVTSSAVAKIAGMEDWNIA